MVSIPSLLTNNLHLKIGKIPKGRPRRANFHPFSGAKMLVSGRVYLVYMLKEDLMCCIKNQKTTQDPSVDIEIIGISDRYVYISA